MVVGSLAVGGELGRNGSRGAGGEGTLGGDQFICNMWVVSRWIGTWDIGTKLQVVGLEDTN